MNAGTGSIPQSRPHGIMVTRGGAGSRLYDGARTVQLAGRLKEEKKRDSKRYVFCSR